MKSSTLWSRYFECFKCKEFPQYMQELEISELDISKKNLIRTENLFLLWEDVVVLKELILPVSI